MRAKLIYKECRESNFGAGFYYSDRIVEFEGKYYKVEYGSDFTGTRRSISNIEIDPENLPEEYSRTQGREYYWLEHGKENEEVEIDLTEYGFTEELRDIAKKEQEIKDKEIEEERAKKLIEVTKESRENLSNSYYYSDEFIEKSDLTEKEKEIAKKVRDRIGAEYIETNIEKLVDYSIDEKFMEKLIQILPDIVQKRAFIMTTTKETYYHAPGTFIINDYNIEELISPEKLKDGVIYYPQKTEKLRDDRTYLGSIMSYCYKSGMYPVDFFLQKDKNGETHFEIDDNLEWYPRDNQRPYYVNVKDIGIDRYDISTGEKEEFNEVNNELKEKRERKKAFYIGVMKRAKEQFGLSNKKAKELLEFAGTVSALDMALELDERGLTTQQAEAILRKISYRGVDKVLDEAGMEDFPWYKFDIIQSAAATLIHHREAEEIADGIEPTETGMKAVEEEMVKVEEKGKEGVSVGKKTREEFGDN